MVADVGKSKRTGEVTDLADCDSAGATGWRWSRMLCHPDLSRALFLVGFIVILVWRVSTSSLLAFPDGSLLNTAIHYGSLLALALSSVLGEKRPARMVVGICLFILGAVVYLRSGDPVFVDLSVTLYACSLFPMRWTVKVGAITVAVAVTAVMVASQLGIVEDYMFPRGGGVFRHGLGFLYCTFPSHYLLSVVLAYLYLRGKRLGWLEYLPILAANFAIYILTDSRNSFLLVLLVVACSVALRFNVFQLICRSGLMGGLIRWAFVACAALCIVATVAYDGDSEAWTRANSVLSNRLEQTQASLYRYGVTPFGSDITFLTNGLVITEDGAVDDETVKEDGDTNFVDSSYMNILIRLGAVSLIASVALMTAGCWRAVFGGDLMLQFCLAVTALHSIVDTQMLELPYNLLLIVAFNSACILLEDRIIPLSISRRDMK